MLRKIGMKCPACKTGSLMEQSDAGASEIVRCNECKAWFDSQEDAAAVWRAQTPADQWEPQAKAPREELPARLRAIGDSAPDWLAPLCAKVDCYDAARELERLIAIVDRLPKTADGDVVANCDEPMLHNLELSTLWWTGGEEHEATDHTHTARRPISECRLDARLKAEEEGRAYV